MKKTDRFEKKQKTGVSQCPIEGEIWKSIPGYEGYYEASNMGRIRSITRQVRNWGTHKQRKDSIILKPNPVIHGYNAVCMYRDGEKMKFCKVHRLVASAFLGPSDLQVNHKDGNRRNNKLENLEWCTGSENNKHAFKFLGRKPKINHKLTLIDVQVVKECLAAGFYQYEIANYFKVCQSAISHIARGKTWGAKTVERIKTGNYVPPKKESRISNQTYRG